ncbi:MAG: helix-turn-helix domain-containing protein [Dehalococcoidia bacterium]
MSDDQDKTIGGHIRRNIIPDGMSVTDAAKKLRVGRPALSNLLNGNAALSEEMALRLEKAFGANRQELMDLQARLDRGERSRQDRTVAVGAYVPSFLSITARQIEHWADGNLAARSELPVFLRRLIHSTGAKLQRVDFPGHDNAERRGWDGWVENTGATPWIPDGASGWEFGTNKNPSSKANGDYSARVKSVPKKERANLTFVFVTPRNWPGKKKWEAERNAAGDWKAVRAFDASDLEQWLETSISARIWLAEELNIPTAGFETLQQSWDRWRTASEPELTAEMFGTSVNAYRKRLVDWLSQPSERPFVVAADSKDEALAFLSCLFSDTEISQQAGDLAAVFESGQTLKALVPASAPFLPIAITDEAERELAQLYRERHCIVVRPRNAVDSEPDIALDLLGQEEFEAALLAMGLDNDTADLLARESGRSPTILRRRLSKIDAIRRPEWAREERIARALIPMTLIGAWHTRSSADCEVISTLADRPYSDVEDAIAELLQLDDSPVWSVRQYRGVTSKIDALYALSRFVTEQQLSDFLLIAEYVLSESDPALDLPEDQRWAAGIYGKLRDHSAALRNGVCETLVVLAVHGDALFRDRLGFGAGARVALVIRRLLTPLTLEKLLSQDRDLPNYAETAPDELLSLLEADLRQQEPEVLGLLKPVSSGLFGGCPRTGLLWALECLAWKPQNLGRVCTLLAQLSRTPIDDNWANKPIASLQAIFRSWMPQTSASLDDRIKTLEMLVRRFPDIAWQICIDQFSPGSRVGSYSYRPRWRSDASGSGRPVSGKERYKFARTALTLAIGWESHDEETLGDLVERIQMMAPEDEAEVWELIDAWAESTTAERPKAALRERIRRYAFTRRGKRRDLDDLTRKRARAAYERLAPADPTVRHAWLFENQWVDESAEELEDEDLNLTKREERVHGLRSNAMTDIWTAKGLEGVLALLDASKAPGVVGYYLGSRAADETEAVEVLRKIVALEDDHGPSFDALLGGFIQSLNTDIRGTVLTRLVGESTNEQAVRIFRCAPFRAETWRLLDKQEPAVRDRYWQEVDPRLGRFTEAELTELLDRLLDAHRPRAAVHAAHLDWTKVETSRLKRLLTSVGTDGGEAPGSYRLDPYDISSALKELNTRGVTRDEMAQLEFMLITALDRSEHGIPNLERQLAESPALFVQAIALAYRRNDSGEDPPGWTVNDPDRRAAVATAAHHLLEHFKRIPGTTADGSIDEEALRTWVLEARRLCVEHGRAEVGDQRIGQLLSGAPSDEDGLQPCRAVCEVMEWVASEDIGTGFHIGIINSRGVVFRGPGGDQERALAETYRKSAIRLAHEYPYVSAVLEGVAVSYDRDAEREDSETLINRRLRGWA